jgi:3,4-dihydroxy 2-butanone 4-phosphate synthase/GTP cyclohydrolase II
VEAVESACRRAREAVAAIRGGRMVILVDDEDRENEGDLCVAAEKVTPAAINFMATHGRGLVCLALTEDRVRRLGLPLMVAEDANTSGFGTAFTVTIEAARGVTTGISAHDRAHTILTAIGEACRPEDLVRPGHVFPLRARRGGVLERRGQTEGSVDLARLAGLAPAGVICEVMNDDGTMARRPELEALARRFDLLIVSIADLIAYRLATEAAVRRGAVRPLSTRHGEFREVAYEDERDGGRHVALVKGTWRPEEPVLVGVHRACLAGDVFGATGCECGARLDAALARLEAAGRGVLLYLDHRGPGALRGHGLAARILRDLGLSRVRLLGGDAARIAWPRACGVEVVECVPLEPPRPPRIVTGTGRARRPRCSRSTELRLDR